MLTCKDVSKLVSESLDRKLPLRQRMAVRLHIMMCRMCRAYQKQTLLLRNAVKAYAHSLDKGDSSESLPEDAAHRIKKALKTEEK
jgi:hypothetical protein